MKDDNRKMYIKKNKKEMKDDNRKIYRKRI